MSRAAQERNRRQRPETLTREDLYRRVYAVVAAWQETHGGLDHRTEEHATAITAACDGLRTGITEAQRRDAIRVTVSRHMGAAWFAPAGLR